MTEILKKRKPSPKYVDNSSGLIRGEECRNKNSYHAEGQQYDDEYSECAFH